MAFITEVINLSKIKEGFYIGDETTATNLDVIIKFKLTHVINAAGNQVVNAWETIGIKYLTLNWADDPSQQLFDPKDEIANKIVTFIEDSLNKGEGLLVHSTKAHNRVCIVVIIYLMTRYKWTFSKCNEFLRSKKTHVIIPEYFLNQIVLFESRIIQKGDQVNKDLPWGAEAISDPDEFLIRNTYVNGLLNNSPIIFFNTEKYKPKNDNKKEKKHIEWADSGLNKQDLFEQMNPYQDLINSKEIKPVTAHIMLTPRKSSLKNKNLSTPAFETISTTSWINKTVLNQLGNENKSGCITVETRANEKETDNGNNLNTNDDVPFMTQDTGYNLSEFFSDDSPHCSNKNQSDSFSHAINININLNNNINSIPNINKIAPIENTNKLTSMQGINSIDSNNKGADIKSVLNSETYKYQPKKLLLNNNIDDNNRISHFDQENESQNRSYSSKDNKNNTMFEQINPVLNHAQETSPEVLIRNHTVLEEIPLHLESKHNNQEINLNDTKKNKDYQASVINNNSECNSNSINKNDNKEATQISSDNQINKTLTPPSIEILDININSNDNNKTESKPPIEKDIANEYEYEYEYESLLLITSFTNRQQNIENCTEPALDNKENSSQSVFNKSKCIIFHFIYFN